MMFALGIIDKLTRGYLTGGRFIAGTGEIEADGAVDPIGGIQQKMAGRPRGRGDHVPQPGGQLLRHHRGRCRPGCAWSRSPRSASAIADLNALKDGQPVPAC